MFKSNRFFFLQYSCLHDVFCTMFQSFLPPHIGRYIQRCMRNMTPGAAPGPMPGFPPAPNGAAAPDDKKDEKDKPSYEEYLNGVGANIAAFLDPFGELMFSFSPKC